jgi:hypothetical protein|tara:strand:+ start:9828 stop:11039 length:1212 start_codon:yes stop_codon:yes gene_type:complete
MKIITPNTNISTGSIKTSFIKDGAVSTAKIADGAVTAGKIADGTVVAAELATDAVTTVKILDANVTTAKIADDAVTLAKISTTGASNNQVLTYNSSSGAVEWGAGGTSSFDPANAGAIANTTNILPAANDTHDIGSPSLKYQDVHAVTFQGTAVLTDNITLSGTAGDILTYQATNEWRASASNTVRNFKLSGTPVGSSGGGAIGDPVLKLISSNSGWDKAHIKLVDSNDECAVITGRNNTDSGSENYHINYTLDPTNSAPRTNVGGTGNTYAGDYYMAFRKLYDDTDEIEMDMQVFGAHNGFNIEVKDDSNGTNWSDGLAYNWKPLRLRGSEIVCQVGVGLVTPVEQVKVERYRTSLSGNLKLHVASSDPTDVAPTAGDLYFNNSTNPGKVKVYNGTAWEALH